LQKVLSSLNMAMTRLMLVGSAADRVDRLEGKECGSWTRRIVPALGKAWP
jgi:hypothetical protein